MSTVISRETPREQGGTADSVGVVVTVDDDLFPGLDGHENPPRSVSALGQPKRIDKVFRPEFEKTGSLSGIMEATANQYLGRGQRKIQS